MYSGAGGIFFNVIKNKFQYGLFRKKLNLKILLKNEIDESLLGGVKVVVENHVMDGSIKNRMDLLKQELLRK